MDEKEDVTSEDAQVHEKGRERGERKRKTRLRKEEVIHNKGHFFPNNRKPSE